MLKWCDTVHLIIDMLYSQLYVIQLTIRSETILLVRYLIMHLFSLCTLFADCMLTYTYRWSFGICLWEMYTLGKFYNYINRLIS